MSRRVGTGAAAVLALLLLCGPGCDVPPCADGMRGAAPPRGSERYCARLDQDGIEVRHGLARSWYPDGKLHDVCNWVQGKREGRCTTRGADGQVEEEGVYRDDKRQGVWRLHHGFHEEIRYRNGVPHGRSTRCYENGIVMSSCYYRDGKREGTFISWHPNGIKSSRGSYRNGLRDGLWTWWHDNGVISQEARFERGRQDGLRIHRDRNGRVIQQSEPTGSGLRIRTFARLLPAQPTGHSR